MKQCISKDNEIISEAEIHLVSVDKKENHKNTRRTKRVPNHLSLLTLRNSQSSFFH